MSRQSRVALFLIDGFEETEALCTADILRRGGVLVTLVSLGNDKTLTGRSGIVVRADRSFTDIGEEDFEMLVIPGGSLDYVEHQGLLSLVQKYAEKGKLLAAICAAPAVFGKLGILKDRRATCYPGIEGWLTGAQVSGNIVETDGNITTSKGPGTTVPFALRLLDLLHGKETAQKVAQEFIAQGTEYSD